MISTCFFPDGVYRPSHRGSNGESWKRQLIFPHYCLLQYQLIGSGFDMSNCGHIWPVLTSHIPYRTNIMVIKHDECLFNILFREFEHVQCTYQGSHTP